MIEYDIGQVVFSKCGHDKGKTYIIISVSDEYVYLVDGDVRTLQKAKKKKFKHVQVTQYIQEEVKAKLKSEQSGLTDADLRKALKPYKDRFMGLLPKEV